MDDDATVKHRINLSEELAEELVSVVIKFKDANPGAVQAVVLTGLIEALRHCLACETRLDARKKQADMCNDLIADAV
jgi:hypothetical protein